MKIRPDYTRLLMTIRLEEPACVPLAELVVDRSVKDGLLGKPVRDVPSDVEFWWKVGYDYKYLCPAYEYAGLPPQVVAGTPMVAEASALDDREAESVSIMLPGSIVDLADLEPFPWPDPVTIDYSNLVEAAACLPDGMDIISGVGGIFTRAWMLLGFDRFCHSFKHTSKEQ